MSARSTRLQHRPLHDFNEAELLIAAVELVLEINGKVDKIMSDIEQLAADEGALERAFAQLTTDLTVALTDIHAQIAALQGNPADVEALRAVDGRIAALIDQVQVADASVRAADPGPQPDPDTSMSPLPDETAVPTPPETPETPATPSAPDDEDLPDSPSV